MKHLYVFYEDLRVGTLTRDADLIYSFVYTDEWIESPRHFPLSLSMPLKDKSFGNKITLSFFENLMPEGEVREVLKRDYHVDSAFDFLKFFGRDSAGAIVVSDQEDYPQHVRQDAIEEVNLSMIYSALEEKESVAGVIAGTHAGYLSLAGAQDKFPAIFRDGKLFLPTQGSPTTHIVKVPIWRSGVKESVYNEYYCMELARSVGLQVPKTDIIPGPFPLFIVERYDRFKDAVGQVHRIHQQDFCQAQGITSELKYEDKGGPTLLQNYEVILKHVSPQKRLESVHLFLDWICFNLLIGNNDCHSKNISLLLLGGKNEFAPLYDLICTAIYPKLLADFAFNIGDRRTFKSIGNKQFELLEEQLGVKQGTVIGRFSKLSQRVLEQKEDIVKKVAEKDPKAKIAARISRLIEDRWKSLRLQGLPL